MNTYWIGIDGTDSPFGGCTTWTLSNIIDALLIEDPNTIFCDFPRLIRLNPNIPEKTRGNGALALHIKSKLPLNRIKELVVSQIQQDQQLYQLNPDKLPGAVFMEELKPTNLYNRALSSYLSIDEIKHEFAEIDHWPAWTQSHIGALAAIYAILSEDYTYELLTYRSIDVTDQERNISADLVQELDTSFPSLFSSYDKQNNRELIAPSGPDPVFCGIRADSYQDLPNAVQYLQLGENIKSYTIFKTNQATDAHVMASNNTIRSIPLYKPQDYEVFTGLVNILSEPEEIIGGHIFTTARYGQEILGLSWFEPTKGLRDAARQLASGDVIQITGAVKFNEGTPFIQIEYMMIVSCPDRISYLPPKCSCGNRMTSAGTFAGYKCKVCGNNSKHPEIVRRPSILYHGQQCYASKSAQRHLTRPLCRIHRRNQVKNTKENDNIVDYSQFRHLYD